MAPCSLRSVFFLGVAALSTLLLPGCADIDGAEDEDEESEPSGMTSEAIISNASCTTTRMTAYDKGKPYPIDVIQIGSKRVSIATGHALLKMQKAADSAGVSLTLSSGFRTNEEQQYFYNCYKNGNCNSGNLAAKPGYSNHQNGRALDLSTSSWLAKNAAKFGFKRTVPKEAWHYEFDGKDPGGPCTKGSTPTKDGTPLTPEPAAEPQPQPQNESKATAPEAASDDATTCGSDGQCNPGNDGAGLICTGGRCVAGCRSNAQCPGVTTCRSGQCK